MASCSSLLSEDQFQCSICLDVFTEPVTIPCGHNYCKACITRHWDNNDVCQCPLCQKNFVRKPDIFVNTMFRDVVEKFRMNVRVKYESHSKPGDVSCDVCTGRKLKAKKSCPVCQTSYCETHLEPHQRVAALKKHKLIDPVENLEDRMCQKHERPLELFCRTDQTCVCLMCVTTDHQTHDTVSLEEEYSKRKATMHEILVEMNTMIQIRSREVEKIKRSVETSKRDALEEISDSIEVFTALVRAIEKSRAELIEMIEEKQKAAEKQADESIKDLEQEITELKRRSTELNKFSHSDDHLHLLQSIPSLSTPQMKDYPEVSVDGDLYKGALGRTISQLKDALNKEMENIPIVKLKRIQQYAVAVTLDPDTAHPKLCLSEDGKQVTHADLWNNLPDSPERFNRTLGVLGMQDLSAGRSYYEVEVKGKIIWDLGVASKSINRKWTVRLVDRPEDGYWTLSLRNGNEYTVNAAPGVLLSLRQKPQKVGVFVDYERGLVSFYDVEARSHIYSYTGCTFKGKLYPYFSPSSNHGGKNAAPLIISL
ncbi:E3 ubiquitin-protein ligase TRIM39-like [Osmerus mordax]|uniref:E3 ubiquitin-protein ligase TRIM39-like n=1 Tax=Osmerus mordax TaxID=8014 RepID=UPI00351011AD